MTKFLKFLLQIAGGFDGWPEWADGHCRYIFPASCEEAKRHSSGWAMRNTNNHNVNILKKSCLGVLICNRRCLLPSGNQVGCNARNTTRLLGQTNPS